MQMFPCGWSRQRAARGSRERTGTGPAPGPDGGGAAPGRAGSAAAPGTRCRAGGDLPRRRSRCPGECPGRRDGVPCARGLRAAPTPRWGTRDRPLSRWLAPECVRGRSGSAPPAPCLGGTLRCRLPRGGRPVGAHGPGEGGTVWCGVRGGAGRPGRRPAGCPEHGGASAPAPPSRDGGL